MKQHAIPQNVLDVEFKLFTKFTVKEFAYMAAGVTFGGLFLYLWTTDTIPGIVAFPIFLMSAGTGLVLGLVPINDQSADKFLANYMQAITNPTQRVWQNEDFKEKVKAIAQQRGLTFEKITVDPEEAKKEMVTKKPQIIGGNEELNPSQFVETAPVVNEIDKEEEMKLAAIEKAMEENGMATITPQPTAPAPIPEAVKSEPIRVEVQPNNGEMIINRTNITNYAIPNVNLNLPGTVNMILATQDGHPASSSVAIIKDSLGKPISAIKSGRNGEILMQKALPQGEYSVEVINDQYKFPNVRYIVDGGVFPLIKVTAI